MTFFNNDKKRLEELANNSSSIISMLKHVFTTSKGIDYWNMLAMSSGLAGYSCHMAVKENNQSFVIVETNKGKKYFFGDNLNKYLLEDKYSVLSFVNGIYNHLYPNKETPDIHVLVKNSASVIGNENYKIWGMFSPETLFKNIQSCWNGIYENMTGKYCRNPDEWSILFGIVLQNIMAETMKEIEPDIVYKAALECALYISKMDIESL